MYTSRSAIRYSVTVLASAVFLACLSLALVAGSSRAQTAPTISFGKGALAGEDFDDDAANGELVNPTSLQFGPDGRLYVAQQNGTIKAYTVKRDAANSYSVTATETINLIKSIPNHNDDGTLNTSVNNRQVTGILVTGTAANPVIYVTSSDPRIGGSSKGDLNLDTNSGVISKLTWNGSSWAKQDLVRGLPRSEENHSQNGLQLKNGVLYVTSGGNTNKGAPSKNFALLPEYALSAAILSIDLAAIGNTTYDLPTLDDPGRAGSPDKGDPFGGNNGLNQAKLVSGGPVQVYAPGFRNAYDVVIAQSDKIYTIDNGGNGGWGDIPKGEGPAGNCTNEVSEPGTTDADSLHLAGVADPSKAGYYGGHPNPTRANKANTFGGQTPIEVAANQEECDYRANGAEKGNLAQFSASTNGIDEYTASNFDGALQGDLLTASFDGTIYRIKLNSTGDGVAAKEALFSNFGSQPLDVTAQGDNDKFAGTVWAATYGADTIVVFEPAEAGSCDISDPNGDEDGDGYTNQDEQAAGTDPCSAADVPPDYDKDKISNKTDPDDDNDTKPDTSDPFAVDKNNGETTGLPLRYTWDPGASNPGGLEGYFGFTGLMTNSTANYASLYDPTKMTVGGAAGAFTVDAVPAGDAVKATNTQEYGFQSGVDVGPSTGLFTARTRILAPFAGITPENSQSMGLFIGTGDQDNYAKVVVSANGGNGGVQFAKEVGGAFGQKTVAAPVLGSDYVDLYLTVDPAAGTVQPSYAVTKGGVTGQRTDVGSPVKIPSGWVDGTGALAAGFISTSYGPGPPFPATWDFIEVVSDQPASQCTITGTSSGETLTGTEGDDVICGLGGNDTVKGLGGNDTLKGEGGADKLFGGAGDDAFDGGLGVDAANFSGSAAGVTASLTDNAATGEGSDVLAGVENLVGSKYADTLGGSGGANQLWGGAAADVLRGLEGADKLNGGGGNDSQWGGPGNDSVVGSGGADGLNGEDGDDSLNSKDGVSGNDSLDGGIGTDACVTDATEKSVINCEQ